MRGRGYPSSSRHVSDLTPPVGPAPGARSPEPVRPDPSLTEKDPDHRPWWRRLLNI